MKKHTVRKTSGGKAHNEVPLRQTINQLVASETVTAQQS